MHRCPPESKVDIMLCLCVALGWAILHLQTCAREAEIRHMMVMPTVQYFQVNHSSKLAIYTLTLAK